MNAGRRRAPISGPAGRPPLPRTVLVVGNPLVAQDGMPLRIMAKLRERLAQFEFRPFEPTREDLPGDGRELVIIDTLDGAKEAVVLKEGDLHRLVSMRACSLHDFDLGAQLLLLDKFGLLGKVRIIGVPARGKTAEIAAAVERALNALD